MRTVLLMAAWLAPLCGAGAWEHESLRLRGKLMTRFEVEERTQDDSWTSRFKLEHARLDARFTPTAWAQLNLELEGAGWLELSDRYTPDGDQEVSHATALRLRDAYGKLSIVKKKLQLSVGQFKKPFSRLRLTSPWALFVPERGLLDGAAVDQTRYSGFGGRDVGAMAHGRFKKLLGLRYALGVFSGPRFVDRIESSVKDYLCRIELRPLPALSVALDWSHKVYHYRQGVVQGGVLRRGAVYTGNLLGADARLDLGDLTLLAEGALGDNVDLGPGHRLWGAHLTAAYALLLGDELRLTPALMAEVFDPDDGDQQDPALRLAGTLNLDLRAGVRLLVYFEGTRGEVLRFDPEAADGHGGFVSRRPGVLGLAGLNLSF